MIGIYNDAGARLAQTFNGLTLNNPADDADDTYEVNRITYSVVIDAVIDPHQNKDGLEAGPARKVSLLIRVDGMVRAPSIAKLFDKVKALVEAFDPAKISHENADSFLAYDFTTPSVAGNVAARYYVRPRDLPTPPVDMSTGNATPFTLELLAADPRRYAQTEDTLAGAGTATNGGDYPTWPTLTITMAGAGAANYTADLTTDTPLPLVLDLTGLIATSVVVVDMESKRITVDGVEDASRYVSGDYFQLEPGANTVAYSNTTNASSVLSWRDAYCL